MRIADSRTPFSMTLSPDRSHSILDSRLVLVGIIALGVVLRALQLDFQPLWWDEGYSVFFATRDLATMLARTAVDIHPPLYYALLQAWLGAFGTSVPVLRALSVLIGAASIPLLYLVARDLFNPRVGIVSAFLLAIAPLPIYYSQEVRMYGLVMLLTLASVALQLRILAANGRRRSNQVPWFAAYAVVTALALYTQYFAAFLVASEIAVVAYLALRAGWRIEWRKWIIAWVAIGLLYLPWVIYAGPKLFAYVTAKVGIEQYTRLDPLMYLVQHLAAFSMGHVTSWSWLAWGAIAFGLLALLGVLASRRLHVGDGNSEFAIQNYLTAIYLLVPLALGFLVNLVYTFHPVRYERLLLFAAPFFLIYVACGLVALFERERAVGMLATGVIAVLCAASLFDFYTVPRYPDEDYRPLIQEMSRTASENDLVYGLYPWQLGYLESYYAGPPLTLYEVDGETWTSQPEIMSRELARLRDEYPRAWILAYQVQGRMLEDRLTNEYINDYMILDQTYGNTRLEYFAQGSVTDFELIPVEIAPDLTLRIQYAAFEPSAKPELALARFLWHAENDLYAYSLRVTDASGNKIAQQDDAIPNGTAPVRRALALPKNLAPGTYTLQLVAYHRADGSALTMPNGARALSLAEIVVAP